jgi:four helix bundle protein
MRSCWTPGAAALLNQLQRASLSVQLNIAEGYTFGESPSFNRHLGIAYGSAVETSELIQLVVDAGVVPAEIVNVLQAQSGRCQRLLLGMLKRRRKLKPKAANR